MKTTKTERDTKMNTIIKDGVEYLVEEIGSMTVPCTAKGFCTLPGYSKKRLIKREDGSFDEKVKKFHKLTPHTLYTKIEKG
jgi:hypothetical protein